MTEWRADDICPRPETPRPTPATPLAPPLYPSTVWRCASPDDANALMAGECDGYAYQRDGHPNADMLADKCRRLHEADHATITSSGMAALALALVSQTGPGDRVLVSRHVYGKTLQLLESEGRRWGLETERFDPFDEPNCDAALDRSVRLVVVETVSNPRLRVPDLARLSDRVDRAGGRLLVDNTFASPILCRPLRHGAHLVMESVTKMMNGHSDAMLGLLCGRAGTWEAVPRLSATWGFASSPWDCWLALRGLASLHVRMARACDNAMAIARMLAAHARVAQVDYPGLETHPDHERARTQFADRFGSMVTFTLKGGALAANRFIEAVRNDIPFCPSLGEISTTLSHPQSTSHRGLSETERAELGVSGGTIRLSCGIESTEFVERTLGDALDAC
ncbi:MAG: hypothetical protein FJ297_06205 [Planctomycetes bacterium]|nr:hypothetical protein [Planctomycetota bacterium]